MSDDKVPVVVRLKLPDGRVFDCHEECLREYADSQQFWWTEGNGACDCNRSLSINREYNYCLNEDDSDASDDDNDDPAWNCGDRIELLSLVVDGVEVFKVDAVK